MSANLRKHVLQGSLATPTRPEDVLSFITEHMPVPSLPEPPSSALSSAEIRRSRKSAKTNASVYDPQWSTPSAAFPLYPLESRSITANRRTFVSEANFVLAQHEAALEGELDPRRLAPKGSASIMARTRWGKIKAYIDSPGFRTTLRTRIRAARKQALREHRRRIAASLSGKGKREKGEAGSGVAASGKAVVAAEDTGGLGHHLAKATGRLSLSDSVGDLVDNVAEAAAALTKMSKIPAPTFRNGAKRRRAIRDAKWLPSTETQFSAKVSASGREMSYLSSVSHSANLLSPSESKQLEMRKRALSRATNVIHERAAEVVAEASMANLHRPGSRVSFARQRLRQRSRASTPSTPSTPSTLASSRLSTPAVRRRLPRRRHTTKPRHRAPKRSPPRRLRPLTASRHLIADVNESEFRTKGANMGQTVVSQRPPTAGDFFPVLRYVPETGAEDRDSHTTPRTAGERFKLERVSSSRAQLLSYSQVDVHAPVSLLDYELAHPLSELETELMYETNPDAIIQADHADDDALVKRLRDGLKATKHTRDRWLMAELNVRNVSRQLTFTSPGRLAKLYEVSMEDAHALALTHSSEAIKLGRKSAAARRKAELLEAFGAQSVDLPPIPSHHSADKSTHHSGGYGAEDAEAEIRAQACAIPLATKLVPSLSPWEAAEERMLDDLSSAPARRKFYQRLVEFVTADGGVFSPSHAALIKWVRDVLASGAAADVEILIGAVSEAVERGWRTRAIRRLLHYLRTEFRISRATYAAYLTRLGAPELVGESSDSADLPFVPAEVSPLLVRYAVEERSPLSETDS
ncbi:uncharacterized protein AMSG_01758 [Thecamonas trahens ATCC 50062]|uniref:Uncharacterized protein n=1 Tax=Thecamonas trahens ATCC 50062 TaxID=461836 RepID=A0A0L0DT12_THETB|nr:hypothetical protein AMSG_01758 [Thecamonas trahens ATCC 50062]KNC55494.1 hypothetical protein AMSG_01758 [Thecamonas trahens ATCC 50062]|eukprot:XP_013761274.1 hypothetical protein AMSG_01758 [Thecamonas trahens ATCC 50062]